MIRALGEGVTDPLDLQAVFFPEALGSVRRHQIGHLEDDRVELRLQTVDFRRRLLDLTGKVSDRRDGRLLGLSVETRYLPPRFLLFGPELLGLLPGSPEPRLERDDRVEIDLRATAGQ